MRAATGLIIILFSAIIVGVGVFGILQASDGGSLNERWSSDTVRDYQSNHHPIAAGTMDREPLIVAPINEISSTEDLSDTSCALVRLNTTSGDAEWQAGLAADHCNNHAIPDPTIADIDGDGSPEVLVARGDHTLTVHDSQTGDIKWQHETTGLGYSEPAVADFLPAKGIETVVVDLTGGLFTIYANGTTAWHHNLDATTWAAPKIADFDGDGNQEIAIGTGSAIHLYDANGEQQWQTDLSTRQMAIGQADNDPTPELFVTGTKELFAFDGGSGSIIWSKEFEGRPNINDLGENESAGAATVYVAVNGGTLHALSGNDGSTQWTSSFPGDNRITPPPTLGDVDGDGTDEIIATTMEGVVYVLNSNNGEQRATYERDVPIWTHATVVNIDSDADDDVLVIYGDGRVVALAFES